MFPYAYSCTDFIGIAFAFLFTILFPKFTFDVFTTKLDGFLRLNMPIFQVCVLLVPFASFVEWFVSRTWFKGRGVQFNLSFTLVICILGTFTSLLCYQTSFVSLLYLIGLLISLLRLKFHMAAHGAINTTKA